MGEGAAAGGLDIVKLFIEADWVVKAVMIGLALASLWSWAVILDKFFRFAAMNAAADGFERQVNSGRSLEEIGAQAGDHPQQPLPLMLVTALKDWREARSKGTLNETQSALVINRIDRSMDSIIAREGRRIEDGLGVLAVVATASPFIGLFGTVWGIMHAFEAIGAAGNTNLATVSPAISEALLATAVGLAAAIPAYIGYNKFTLDASKFIGRLESFADDLGAAVARRISDRIGGAPNSVSGDGAR